MPKENKHSRGRRGEKRKREEGDNEEQGSKRQRSAEQEEIQFVRVGDDNPTFQDEDTAFSTERPFFGLLDEDEQEYFRRADELLELNDFPSSEERGLFLENVYKEAAGKELKIANSQSCSRLMERLILLSTPSQKKKLFEAFSGQFLYLVQHRFASHCCEALFIHSAPIVTAEILGEEGLNSESAGEKTEGEDGVFVSMENLFLFTLNELEGHMSFLLTDRFASHALRVLLVVLSGQPLSQSSTRSLIQSKKKEKIGIAGHESSGLILEKRIVPQSFTVAVQKILSDTVAGLDSTFIHVLATHPTGNPTLQLLLELELTQAASKKTGSSSENKTIIQTLLPDDPAAENSESATFINGLIYDALGSRLLEPIIRFAPGKLFKSLYRAIFRDRIGALSRNEIASFVVIRVLERLSKEDLEAAVEDILPQIPGLAERNRTNVIKTLFERCEARGATKSIASLTEAVENAYHSDGINLLLKMTSTTEESLCAEKPTPPNPATTHGSLLAQALLSIPGPPSTLIQSSLLALSSPTLLGLALTTSTSHILQAALTSPPLPQSSVASLPLLTFRRKLTHNLVSPTVQAATPEIQGSLLRLATSPPGTHVLDAVNVFTSSHSSLMHTKEELCASLVLHEQTLRDDYSGRIVWRNWQCELFRRRKTDWISKVRNGEIGSVAGASKLAGAFGSTPTNGGVSTDAARVKNEAKAKAKQQKVGNGKGGKFKNQDVDASGKTPIELAREKFAAAKIKKDVRQRGVGKATGANAI